jgi:hypothetical protein
MVPSYKPAKTHHSIPLGPSEGLVTQGRAPLPDDDLTVRGNPESQTVEGTSFNVPEANHSTLVRPEKCFSTQNGSASSRDDKTVPGNACCPTEKLSPRKISKTDLTSANAAVRNFDVREVNGYRRSGHDGHGQEAEGD